MMEELGGGFDVGGVEKNSGVARVPGQTLANVGGAHHRSGRIGPESLVAANV